MNFIKNAIVALLLSAYILPAATSWGDNRPLSENQLKAAFLYNVARYVSWPQTSPSVCTIGILGKEPHSSAWDDLKYQSIQGRRLHIRTSHDLDDLLDCQIVYIDESQRKNIPRILRSLQGYPILTVADTPGFMISGGMLQMSFINSRIAFSMHLKNARAAGLGISSNLLKLAREVIK